MSPFHLFIGTHAENLHDAWGKGRMGAIEPARGERCGNAKLTEEAVRAIRASPLTIKALGKLYGVDHTLISMVKRRKIWRHVE